MHCITNKLLIYIANEPAFQYEGGLRLVNGLYSSDGILEVFIYLPHDILYVLMNYLQKPLMLSVLNWGILRVLELVIGLLNLIIIMYVNKMTTVDT